MTLHLKAAALLAGVALALGACGGSDEPASSSAPATSSTTTPETTTSSGSAEKVSANDASEEEIAAALEAKGVDEADRWAHEVEEYRPYPTDDPDLPKLREELAKYNPGPGVVDKIVGALEP